MRSRCKKNALVGFQLPQQNAQDDWLKKTEGLFRCIVLEVSDLLALLPLRQSLLVGTMELNCLPFTSLLGTKRQEEEGPGSAILCFQQATGLSLSPIP